MASLLGAMRSIQDGVPINKPMAQFSHIHQHPLFFFVGVPESPSFSTKRTGSAQARFRGVTKHKRTQRYEAHIWECKKQIYLGGFDSELLAAKSHGE